MKKIFIAVIALASLFFISEASATVVGGRPAGCPRAYCGCAVAQKVGLSGSQWNLAANYLRLPRTSCAPGMVAARRGHVFVIQACHGNGTVTAWDPNSGRGLTRVHTRSLAGYAIVNPRGGSSMLASSRRSRVAWWEPWPHRVLDQRSKARKKPRRAHYASAAR